MTRTCFFVDDAGEAPHTLRLPAAAVHHLRHVLRAREGDPVEVRNGKGQAWLAEIVGLSGRDAAVRLRERLAERWESPLEITLALALGRSDRLEGVIRQATELGVRGVVAFPSARSQYRLDGKRAAARRERWLKIAREALCQCGRTLLPEIRVFSDWRSCAAEMLTAAGACDEVLKLVAWEEERERGLLSVWREFVRGSLILAIGPEGGFSGEEVRVFLQQGFRSVHLGPRTLRFETAAIGMIVACQLLWGDLGGG
jgi:16S rRNA (uracil1498-N3)-methyltransferase